MDSLLYKKGKIHCSPSLVYGVKPDTCTKELHELSSHCLQVPYGDQSCNGTLTAGLPVINKALFSLTWMPPLSTTFIYTHRHISFYHASLYPASQMLHFGSPTPTPRPQIAGKTLHQQKDHNSLYCRTKPTLLPTHACRHITVHVGEYLRRFTVLDKQQTENCRHRANKQVRNRTFTMEQTRTQYIQSYRKKISSEVRDAYGIVRLKDTMKTGLKTPQVPLWKDREPQFQPILTGSCSQS